MSRLLTICSVLFFFTSTLFGQFDYSFRHYYPEFETDQANNLFIRLENSNFLKNNEYFGSYIEGYTLMGYAVQPSVMYYAGEKLRIKAGAHIQKFSGAQGIKEVIPVLSVHARLSNNLDIIMGGLRGNIHHQMLEPLFEGERQYFRPVENGVQFLYNSKTFQGDLWLDWEQFILHGDNFPEKFTLGFSSKINLLNNAKGWNLSVPLQLTATHSGGQISDYEEAMQSLLNTATGFTLSKKLHGNFFTGVSASANALFYEDMTGASGFDFNNGYAYYPNAAVNTKFGDLMLGYWHAHNFLSPRGNPIFQSVSRDRPPVYNAKRNMITSKLSYKREVMRQMKFAVMFESYYDLPASQFDYAYSLHLVFTPNFFIHKVNFY